MAILIFHNFSSEPFSAIPYTVKNAQGQEVTQVDEHCKWNNEPYSFAPGKSEYMEDWKALHLAKHLVDRELTRMKLDTGNQKARDEMVKKCIFKAESNPAVKNEAGFMFQKNLQLQDEPTSTPAPVTEPVAVPATPEVAPIETPVASPSESSFEGLN